MTAQAAQAVSYAQRLGLDSVYAEALKLEKQLESAHEDERHWASCRRELQERILYREAELTAQERAKQSEMSVTAFERHIRGIIRLDTILFNLRSDLLVATENEEVAQHNAREIIEGLRLRTARLTELGGYFQYLAAVRAATPINPTPINPTPINPMTLTNPEKR